MITIEKITFTYHHQKAIFQEFSWSVSEGERWTVLGPSGCGKSTLLFLLAGLVFPSHGTLSIHGSQLSRPRPLTGLIIQDFGLLPWSNVRENAALGIKIRDFYGPDGTHSPVDFQQIHSVDHWLNRLNLQPHASKYPSQLSGGQRQRVAIARTLAMQPDLILMDEPFSSLDAPSREALQNITLELHKEGGLTMVIVTHSIEEAAVLGEKILVLSEPPNTIPRVLLNPSSGKKIFRQSKKFQETCKKLREMLNP